MFDTRKMSWSRYAEVVRLLSVAALALVLAVGALGLVGCSSSSSKDEAKDEKTEVTGVEDKKETTATEDEKTDDADDKKTDTTDDKKADDSEKQTVSETKSDGESGGYGTWAAECQDKWNDPTVYAIAELKGWQLETMLQEMGYTYDKEDKGWSDGKTHFYVLDENLEVMDDEAIAKLDKGGVGVPVLYYMVTPNYPTCKAGYEGLVGSVMVREDSQFSDDLTAAFGVCYGPSMKELLVEMITDENGLSMFVFNSEAIKAGVFDTATEGDYGSTISEVFESLTGRKPGSQH